MLRPGSALGVSAMMQPSDVLVVVVVVTGCVLWVVVVVLTCFAIALTFMLAVGPGLPLSVLKSTAPRLKPMLFLVIVTWAAVGLPLYPGATVTVTLFEPSVKPLRCASYFAVAVTTAVDLLAVASIEGASAAASGGMWIA